MPRTRTTKKLAQRIDLNYFREPHAFRRWRFRLSAGATLAAVLWVAWLGVARDNRAYSAGPLSAAHRVLASRCETCHVREAGAFTRQVADKACLGCHDGPVHHATQVMTPGCASCHVEHTGAVRLAATSDASCTQCHANLQTIRGTPHFAANIDSFSSGHPEFAALRTKARDPGTIAFNHQAHMRRDLKGPDGRPVGLVCGDCHRDATDGRAWPYAAGQEITSVKYAEAPGASADAGMAANPPPVPMPRALMTPPTFAKTCAACHTLQFDKRFTAGVPHDKPEVVRAFVVAEFQAYIANHPEELRVRREPDRNFPERPTGPEYRVLTPAQWVSERTADAEQLLWRKTCKQCHQLETAEGAELPQIAPARITQRWMPHAKFDHSAHTLVTCESCHAAERSRETSDVLLPGIATCQSCHHAGRDAAEARCFECHTYHDWGKRQPRQGTLTLGELAHGAAGGAAGTR